MPELATPTRYNIPVLQQNFQPAQVGPLAVDTRGLAKAKVWGSIAESISQLPQLILQGYNAARIKKKSDFDMQQEQLAAQQKVQRDALVNSKLAEASIPSAVAVDSTANQALGIAGGTIGGEAAGKPALSDFTVSPTGVTYNPEDPALRKAKAEYYSSRGLADFGKNEGLTFASAQAARDAGYEPEGGDLHKDGTITVKKFKPSGIDAKGRAKITDAQKTKLDSAAQLAASIDDLMGDYDKMAEQNMAGPVLGNVEKLKQRFGMGSEEGSRIQAEMNTSLFRIARMLNGAGVLTDKDIARAEGVAPTITMNRPQFKGQLDAVKGVIKDGLETWLQTNAGQATEEQVALAHKAIGSLGGKAAASATTSSADEKPAAKSDAPKVDPNGMVKMKKPDGTPIRVPATKVEEAKKLGAVLAE